MYSKEKHKKNSKNYIDIQIWMYNVHDSLNSEYKKNTMERYLIIINQSVYRQMLTNQSSFNEWQFTLVLNISVLVVSLS